MSVMLVLAGLAALVLGADVLVRGASRLARAAKVTPLVVGLTVVAFGTSAPELAVSVHAARAGQSNIALGNVVGSNIFNVLLILGVAASIIPLVVAQQLVRWDAPLLIAASLLVLLLGMDGRIGRADGLLLFAGLVVYTIWSILQSRKECAEVQQEYARHFDASSNQSNPGGVSGLVLLVLFGLGLLVIGLTIVALGTSLPELVTSVLAAVRGERDIAVGNIVGSNLFNILGVLGLSAVIAPRGVTVDAAALRFDIPVMLAVAIACLPVFFTGHVIARWEGVLFLFYAAAYTTYSFLETTQSRAIGPFNFAMIAFVLPLSAVTLLVAVFRTFRHRGAR